MKMNITNGRLGQIWAETIKRLPPKVKQDLNLYVHEVKDDRVYPGKRFVYASYADTKVISLYTEDLDTLSDLSVSGVMAHELGHAYCHLKSREPSPCCKNIANDKCDMALVLSAFSNVQNTGCFAIDTGADLVAQAWGFSSGMLAFNKEKRPDEDIPN